MFFLRLLLQTTHLLGPDLLPLPSINATYTCRQPNEVIMLTNMNDKQIPLEKQPGVPLPYPGHLYEIPLLPTRPPPTAALTPILATGR